MLKILHTSDWHLGKKLDQYSLAEAHEKFLQDLVELVLKDMRPDLLVVAGDIYDRPVAQTESINLLEDTLARIADLKIPCLITSGNHDSRIRLGTNTRFMRNQGLHFRTRREQISDPVTIEDEDFTLLSYGIPYLEPDADTGDEEHLWHVKATQADVLRYAMSLINRDVAERQKKNSKPIKVLVASHAFIVGGKSSDSERNTKVGTLGEAPSSVFEGADYVAMGHLHGAKHEISSPGSMVLRYSGSPIAYSFSERDHEKQLLLVNITKDGVSEEIQSIPINPWRRMRQFEGTFDELKSNKISPTDDWVKVVLTDTELPMDIEKTLRRKFANLVEIDFKKLHVDDSFAGQGGVALSKLAPSEVMRRFVQHVTTNPTNPDLEKAIDDCCDAMNLLTVAVNK